MKSILFAPMLFLAWNVSLASQLGNVNLDACSLLTKSDVETALGAPVLQPAKDSGKLGEIPYSHCTYKKNSDSVGVLLTVYAYKSKAEVSKYFESSMKKVGDTEPVSGLGDGAYWWKSKSTLFVVKDKYMVSLLLGPSVAGSKAAQDMAAKAVSRIS